MTDNCVQYETDGNIVRGIAKGGEDTAAQSVSQALMSLLGTTRT